MDNDWHKVMAELKWHLARSAKNNIQYDKYIVIDQEMIILFLDTWFFHLFL